MNQKCLECKEPIKGRADKKFCSDACRNAYNNHFNRDSTNLMRRTNRILRKNRQILSELNTTGKTKTTKRALDSKGFNFDYHTNLYTTKTGNTYFFCYEQGYLALENGYYTLVVKQDYVK